MSTLKYVASLPSGTGIVFDYAISPSALSESDRRVHDDTTRGGDDSDSVVFAERSRVLTMT
jgi:hypothetical protein